MNKSKLEYIWLDGYKPTANLRSKTKIVSDFSGKIDDVPMWGFDGSSTLQAVTGSSDCLLKPVAIYPDPVRTNGFLVMCEVLNPDGSPQMAVLQLMMMMMISGLVLSRNIFCGIQKLTFQLVFQKIKHPKGSFIAPLVVKILLVVKSWTLI